MQPAVFLDRDGVIIENRPDYVKSVAEVEFIPGALAALAQLAARPWRIVLVTNQSAVGRGLLTLDTLTTIHTHMLHHLRAAGGRMDGIYFCPHHPQVACACRKPAPGMLLQAAAELGIALTESVLIGDNAPDIGAARAVGVKPALVLTGLGPTQTLLDPSVPRFADLAAAIEALLEAPTPVFK